MDELVSAAEANRRFSRILREVRDGRSYVVTSHSVPVSRILLARLAQEPITSVGKPWRRDDLYDE